MSAKMKRRRRHDRLKRLRAEHLENQLFFAHGRFPSSATSFAMCPCGARAFSRGHDDLQDFWDAHSYCELVSSTAEL